MNDFQSQMIGAVTFVSNIVLWRQTGYFEGASELKPLLHVWSLSIEEQYYFLLPTMMVFIPRRFWKRILIFVLLFSLCLCLFMVNRKTSATFYLLPTRGWELAIGSLGAFIVSSKFLESFWRILFWPALFLLLILPFYRIVGFHPGPDALLICLATLIIILRKHPLLFNLSPMSMLSKVGDISYSLYLVHWPLFAFLNNSWMGDRSPHPPTLIRVGLLLLSFVLAWMLNRYVEEPSRRIDIKSVKRLLVCTAVTSFVLMILPLVFNQGAEIEKDYAYIRRKNYGLSPECTFKGSFSPILECRNSDQPEIMVWGDSYAMHLVPGVVGEVSEKTSVIQATKSACGPLLGVAPNSETLSQQWSEDCISFNDSVLSFLQTSNTVNTVVLSSPFAQYLDHGYKGQTWTLVKKNYENNEYFTLDVGLEEAVAGLKNTIDRVRALGKKVVLIAPPTI